MTTREKQAVLDWIIVLTVVLGALVVAACIARAEPPMPWDAPASLSVGTNPPAPLVITNTLKFTATVASPNAGTNHPLRIVRRVVVREWPSQRELSARLIPEPTGMRPVWGLHMAQGLTWWQPDGWTNMTQTVDVPFTNAGPVGLFFVRTEP